MTINTAITRITPETERADHLYRTGSSLIPKAEHTRSEYPALNPKGKIPLLMDGRIMTEVAAIL